jgi:IS4 transposase
MFCCNQSQEAVMIMGPLFEKFINNSPLSVMARATIEHVLSPKALDALFVHTAERGYQKKLLFSTTVDLMSLVVCGGVPHVQSAFQQLVDRVPVELTNVYEKLQRIEPCVSAALVHHVADHCQHVITALGGTCQELLPGYRVQILDGNHLAGTQKRLQVLRGHSAAALPGQSLVVLDPALMLLTDVIPCTDAHTQERALLEQVLPLVQAKDVWIEDRNFCTVDFLQGIRERQAFFVVRRHGLLTVESRAEFGPEVETATGWVSERLVWVCRQDERLWQCRQIRVRLKKSTADGDWEVTILTNLPSEVPAVKVAALYLARWKIEVAFHELTMALTCEVNTLGYPEAALFGFCVAVVAYNILAVLKAALRVVHGEEKVQKEVSGYYMALEWERVLAGMMIALPEEEWAGFGALSATELAGYLRDWAGKIDLRKIKKAPPRKPTKNKTIRIKDKSPHLSTARLLAEAKKKQQAVNKSKTHK